MASIGTQEKSRNVGILSTLAKYLRDVGQKFTLISVHLQPNIMQCIYSANTMKIMKKGLVSAVLPMQISVTYIRNEGISRAKIEKIRAVQKIPGKILPVN